MITPDKSTPFNHTSPVILHTCNLSDNPVNALYFAAGRAAPMPRMEAQKRTVLRAWDSLSVRYARYVLPTA